MENEHNDCRDENCTEKMNAPSNLGNGGSSVPRTRLEQRSVPQTFDDVCRNWYQQPAPRHYKNAGEYANAVRLWLQQCYYWQNVASAFPYFLLQQMILQQQQQFAQNRQTGEQNRRESRGPATWNTPFSYVIQMIRSITVTGRLGNIPRAHNLSMGRMAEIGGTTN